jgi:hypothetical protein
MMWVEWVAQAKKIYIYEISVIWNEQQRHCVQWDDECCEARGSTTRGDEKEEGERRKGE